MPSLPSGNAHFFDGSISPPHEGKGLPGRAGEGFLQGERGHTMSMGVPLGLPHQARDSLGAGTAVTCYFVGSIKCS